MIRNTCNVVGMDIGNIAPSGFNDIETASSWAVDSVNFCRNKEIMIGTGNDNFSPQATYTIEQSIVTLNNISFVSEADLISFAKEVFILTNIEREKAGLSMFWQSSVLAKTAVLRANELVVRYLESHDRPDGRAFHTVYDENGLMYDLAGENIAMGQLTPQEVVEAWMNSPGHRANILNPLFGHLGVGVAKDRDGVLYWSQNFAD